MPSFPPGYRASGVLLHVASLPSPYGIGDIGPAALAWIDRLHEAGQSWWQALPLGPTGYGNSPYQALSSFAGNELLVSPDGLIEDELLHDPEDTGGSFPTGSIDYEKVIAFKRRVLTAAWTEFRSGTRSDLRPAYDQFCSINQHWLEDYALFRALKATHNGAYYLDWPAELVRRDPAALQQARRDPRPDRSGAVCPIPLVPPGGATKNARQDQECAVDWRSAVLCVARLERCVGEPGVVPAGRAA
jgi:4-alpha-glucanotransferase